MQLDIYAEAPGPHEIRIERSRADDGISGEFYEIEQRAQVITLPLRRQSHSEARRRYIAVDREHGLSRTDFVLEQLKFEPACSDPVDLTSDIERAFVMPDGIGVAARLRDGVYHEQLAVAERAGGPEEANATSDRTLARPHVHIKLEEKVNDGDQDPPNVIWLYDGLMSRGHELRHTFSKDDLRGRTSVDIARLCLAAVGPGPALHMEMLDPILRPERSLLDGGRVVRYGAIPAACAKQAKTLSLDRQSSQTGAAPRNKRARCWSTACPVS